MTLGARIKGGEVGKFNAKTQLEVAPSDRNQLQPRLPKKPAGHLAILVNCLDLFPFSAHLEHIVYMVDPAAMQDCL